MTGYVLSLDLMISVYCVFCLVKQRIVNDSTNSFFFSMFRFDDDGNGYINVDEFVIGFKDLAKTNGAMVDRIAQLLGEDNMII